MARKPTETPYMKKRRLAKEANKRFDDQTSSNEWKDKDSEIFKAEKARLERVEKFAKENGLPIYNMDEEKIKWLKNK